MTCTRARGQILELDAREAPGEELAGHLSACAACHAFYARLRRLEASTGIASHDVPGTTPATGEEPAEFTARVMRAVTAEAEISRTPASASASRPVGLRGWAVGGTLILAGLVAIEFSDVVHWLRGAFGSVIDVALSTMLGVALTIYILLLVGLNLRAVRRFLRLG